MKKVIMCLAMSSVLVACDIEENGVGPRIYDSREIRINAVVQDARAPINSGFSTDFPIGIYARGSAWLAGTSANVINNDNSTVSGSAGHAVTFGSGPYYYPADGSTVNFYAFAPQGTEKTAAAAGASPVVTINMTGQEDVMWASSTGSKVGSAPATNPVFSFAHKLTQLQFTFVAGTAFPTTSKVVSLTINAQPSSADMNVESGTCTFSGSAAMQALSTANQSAGIAITATPGTNANSPIMTNVAVGATPYSATIVVKPASGSNVTYTNVPITVTPVIGSAHMITLTFSETAITATASVADWVTGGNGSGAAL